MMGKLSAVVVRSRRISSELGTISRTGIERDFRIVDSFRHYSQSSTSTGAAAAEEPTGRQSEQKLAPKKSRTGGDMSDDGQVHTPHLQKMRSTRDIIKNAGKEQEERLASENKSAT